MARHMYHGIALDMPKLGDRDLRLKKSIDRQHSAAQRSAAQHSTALRMRVRLATKCDDGAKGELRSSGDYFEHPYALAGFFCRLQHRGRVEGFDPK